MFRASHKTSALAGLVFGSLIGFHQRTADSSPILVALIVVIFFVGQFLFVCGLPQYREAMARREERAACRQLHRPDDRRRSGSNFRLFYIPVWGRMATFGGVSIIAAIVFQRL
jgi:hypothetical protein